MVYVTKIDGTFIGNDGVEKFVRYRMSGDRKKQCVELSERFEETLNVMLDGLVQFEVDSYFTVLSIGENEFNNNKWKNCVFADKIPELNNSGILDSYRSVLTLYSFDGDKDFSFKWKGVGGDKYATVSIDNAKMNNNGDIITDEYNSIIGTCVGALIDTIEYGITCYRYRATPYLPAQESDRLYLLNQYPAGCQYLDKNEISDRNYWCNSEKIGVPYGFWTNEIFAVTIKPKCINGISDGYEGSSTVNNVGTVHFGNYGDYENNDGWEDPLIKKQDVQRVPKGSRTTILYPIPKNGYGFVGWSDGCKEQIRVVTDIQDNITLIAYFERLSYTVEYKAQEGGYIDGDVFQKAFTGDYYTSVKAIADDGYEFVGWSDGWKNASRWDCAGKESYDVDNDEMIFRGDFIVEAIFKRVNRL